MIYFICTFPKQVPKHILFLLRLFLDKYWWVYIQGVQENIFSNFATSSSSEMGCYFLCRKWPTNKSKCMLRFFWMHCSPTCSRWVAMLCTCSFTSTRKKSGSARLKQANINKQQILERRFTFTIFGATLHSILVLPFLKIGCLSDNFFPCNHAAGCVSDLKV